MAMKRSSRRRLTRGGLYLLLLVAVVLVLVNVDWAAVQENFLDAQVLGTMWPELITIAAKNTIIYTLIAFVGGLAVALVLALMKLSAIGPYRWLATGYIEFFRGLPALVVIFAFALAVPLVLGRPLPYGTIGAGVIALIVVSAAYMAETLRAGIQAVPKGQVEAARSLGMNSLWTTTSVVLPQAFRMVIPPLTNELVILIQGHLAAGGGRDRRRPAGADAVRPRRDVGERQRLPADGRCGDVPDHHAPAHPVGGRPGTPAAESEMR